MHLAEKARDQRPGSMHRTFGSWPGPCQLGRKLPRAGALKAVMSHRLTTSPAQPRVFLNIIS